MSRVSRWRDDRAARRSDRRARYGLRQLDRLDAGKRLTGRQFYAAMMADRELEDREREADMIAGLEELGVIEPLPGPLDGHVKPSAASVPPPVPAEPVDRKLRPGDPGHWQAHLMIVPDGPGDFTPVTADEHHGDELTAHGPVSELFGILLPALEDREADQ